MIDNTLLEDKKIEAPDTVVEAIDEFKLEENVRVFNNKYSIQQPNSSQIQTALDAYIYGLINHDDFVSEIKKLQNGDIIIKNLQEEIIKPFLKVWEKVKKENDEIDSIINRKDELVLESDTPGFLDILQNEYTEEKDQISESEHETLQKAGIVLDDGEAEQNDSSLNFVKRSFVEPVATIHTESNHTIPSITKTEPTQPSKQIPKPPKKDLYLEPIV